MMPRFSVFILVLIAQLDLSWSLPLAVALQAPRFSDIGDTIPAPILKQLEDALDERNNNLQQRQALAEQIDQVLQAATPESRSGLVEVQNEVRYLEALNNMRLNKLDLCAEQLTQLLATLDAKRFHDLNFRCRSLQAAVMLGISLKMITGDTQRVAANVAGQVGLSTDRIMTGSALRIMSDDVLMQQVNVTAVFAEVERIERSESS